MTVQEPAPPLLQPVTSRVLPSQSRPPFASKVSSAHGPFNAPRTLQPDGHGHECGSSCQKHRTSSSLQMKQKPSKQRHTEGMAHSMWSRLPKHNSPQTRLLCFHSPKDSSSAFCFSLFRRVSGTCECRALPSKQLMSGLQFFISFTKRHCEDKALHSPRYYRLCVSLMAGGHDFPPFCGFTWHTVYKTLRGEPGFCALEVNSLSHT